MCDRAVSCSFKGRVRKTFLPRPSSIGTSQKAEPPLLGGSRYPFCILTQLPNHTQIKDEKEASSPQHHDKQQSVLFKIGRCGIVENARALFALILLSSAFALTPPPAAKRGASESHSVPRAFRSGALDTIISPVNGRPSSKIRKIAHAAEKANNERQAKSVTFSGENRL